ncbi:hypothetical protein ACCD10_26765 [Pseudomonas sp. Pseusp122]|uniref:hypothetical protein n=1 Tax=unclassified Pseudomonas TaxID=196821 RepID=UPI0039A4E5FB
MKIILTAVFLFLANVAQAAERVEGFGINAGAIVDCVPTPGTAVIKSAMYLRETTEPPYPLPVNCEVQPGQPVLARSIFIGEVRKVSRTRFAIVWLQLRLGNVGDAIALDINNGELITSEVRDTGSLRLTFMRSVGTGEVMK